MVRILIEGNLGQGKLSAAGKRFGIVAARWHDVVTSRLIDGAYDTLIQHGASSNSITVVRVPGSFEIPLVCKELVVSKKFDAIVAVGALLRGETSHYDLVAKELSSGLMSVSLESGVPVTFGVIVAENLEQALNRAGGELGNKGAEAAMAAIEVANVIGEIHKLSS